MRPNETDHATKDRIRLVIKNRTKFATEDRMEIPIEDSIECTQYCEKAESGLPDEHIKHPRIKDNTK